MMQTPETQTSLLIQIADQANATAWDRFVAIYQPMILRIGLRHGLQWADADDLTQSVLMNVSRAISTWEKDPARGSFRGWLHKVASNAIINMVQRSPKVRSLGGSEFLDLCNSVEAPKSEIQQMIAEEHDRSVLRTAARRAEQRVSTPTWLAFKKTTIDGASVQQAANELGVSVGKVYGARGRVMRILQQEVEGLDHQPSGDSSFCNGVQSCD